MELWTGLWIAEAVKFVSHSGVEIKIGFGIYLTLLTLVSWTISNFMKEKKLVKKY